MKVYLFNQDFTKSKVAKFTKKQCERNCIDSKPAVAGELYQHRCYRFGFIHQNYLIL